MEQTYQCLFPGCGGQMHQAVGQYQPGQWFCDGCWFTLPDSFFTAEYPLRRVDLPARIAEHRKQLVASRRKELENALAALRKTTLVDDEPEIAQIIQLIRTFF